MTVIWSNKALIELNRANKSSIIYSLVGKFNFYWIIELKVTNLFFEFQISSAPISFPSPVFTFPHQCSQFPSCNPACLFGRHFISHFCYLLSMFTTFLPRVICCTLPWIILLNQSSKWQAFYWRLVLMFYVSIPCGHFLFSYYVPLYKRSFMSIFFYSDWLCSTFNPPNLSS